MSSWIGNLAVNYCESPFTMDNIAPIGWTRDEVTAITAMTMYLGALGDGLTFTFDMSEDYIPFVVFHDRNGEFFASLAKEAGKLIYDGVFLSTPLVVNSIMDLPWMTA